MECHLDAGRKADASSVAGAAATFIKQNVPHLYKQVFGLIVSVFITICFFLSVSMKISASKEHRSKFYKRYI